MGFLKRILSIGKKTKKQRQIVHNVDPGLQAIEEEEHEAAVGRLLRSSSARFTVVSELNYASLPPLPHPINEVIYTPAASTISLASTSTNQRGSYTVTVHKHKHVHTVAEFPNANCDLQDKHTEDLHHDSAYRDNSQTLRLRSDPSVASLLNLYDEHGHLPSGAFSNSPPSPSREGRAQTRRTGSTLRQLLGNPSSVNSRSNTSVLEGDISWAERFLGENEGASTSSLGLPPLIAHDARYSSEHNDAIFSSTDDLSNIISENPAISSMEVELSLVSESPPLLDNLYDGRNPYGSTNPMTPQRASQVFGFLTEKRPSRGLDHDPPSTFSSPSDESSNHDVPPSHFSSNSSSESVCISSQMSIPCSDDTPSRSHNPSDSPPTSFEKMPSLFLQLQHQLPQPTLDLGSDFPVTPNDESALTIANVQDATRPREVRVIMTGPTSLIVTAPTPSDNGTAPSRIPRGPRAPSKVSSSSGNRDTQTALVERSNLDPRYRPLSDPFTPIASRRRTSSQRKSSFASSSAASIGEAEALRTIKPSGKMAEGKRKRDKGTTLTGLEKENSGAPTPSEFPSTPIRSNSTSASRSLFRTAVSPGMFQPPAGMAPSPASSSELSPVGQKLMLDLRQQRMKARESERERKGKREGRPGGTVNG